MSSGKADTTNKKIVKKDSLNRILISDAEKTGTRQITVAKDGTGDYFTLKSAIENNRSSKKSPLVVFVKSGIYQEKLIIDSSLSYLTLIGEQAKSTIITFDDYSGKPTKTKTHTTSSSFSLLVVADHFSAYNIAIKNTAGYGAGQAVALEIKGDHALFSGCQFLGHQDVLYSASASSRCYFEHCYIEGTTDFIFGFGTAWFEQCTIYAKKNAYITAAATPKDHTFGFVFNRCMLLADSTLTQVSLGRPWRDYAAVAVINCYLGKQIIKEGWSNWRGTTRNLTARFSEYNNSGPGAVSKARLPWIRKLLATDVRQYTVKEVLDGWEPKVVLKYKNSASALNHP